MSKETYTEANAHTRKKGHKYVKRDLYTYEKRRTCMYEKRPTLRRMHTPGKKNTYMSKETYTEAYAHT